MHKVAFPGGWFPVAIVAVLSASGATAPRVSALEFPGWTIPARHLVEYEVTSERKFKESTLSVCQRFSVRLRCAEETDPILVDVRLLETSKKRGDVEQEVDPLLAFNCRISSRIDRTAGVDPHRVLMDPHRAFLKSVFPEPAKDKDRLTIRLAVPAGGELPFPVVLSPRQAESENGVSFSAEGKDDTFRLMGHLDYDPLGLQYSFFMMKGGPLSAWTLSARRLEISQLDDGQLKEVKAIGEIRMLLEKGFSLIEKGDKQAGLQFLQQAAAKDKYGEHAGMIAAFAALVRCSNVEAAVKLIETELSRNESYIPALRVAIEAYQRSGDEEKVEALSKKYNKAVATLREK